MLKALNRLKRPAKGPAERRARRVPRGLRVYAIGDIHGRADLLDSMLAEIECDSASRTDERRVLVFLGDYIDRGPESMGVLDRLAAIKNSDNEAYFILGNHEEALLRILAGEEVMVESWLRFGGRECLKSYGADLAKRPPEISAADWVRATIPPAHREFLEDCDDSIAIGDYLFVHAGIRPGSPLSAQRQQDLRWIREPFLSCEDDHGALVVHGHSISEDVDWRENRIGIDTGAYRSGVLTALVLNGSQRRAIQVNADPQLS